MRLRTSVTLLLIALVSSVAASCATTAQAEEEAAPSCHRYCGAVFGDALLGDELPEPLRGSGEATIVGWEPLGYVHALEEDRQVILLDRLLPGQPPRFEVIGVLELGVLEEGTHVAYGTCAVEGNDDARVVAVVPTLPCDEAPVASATRAWRVDTRAERFDPIPADGVTCVRDECRAPDGVEGGVMGVISEG